MKSAIERLEASLDTLVANEPIHRLAGNHQQADIDAAHASEIRQAIAVLKDHEGLRNRQFTILISDAARNLLEAEKEMALFRYNNVGGAFHCLMKSVRSLSDAMLAQRLDLCALRRREKKPGVSLSIQIRLQRDDEIPAFAAFLRCEGQNDDSHVILLNVEACMTPALIDEDGECVLMSREDRCRLVITSLMHEFGHVLERHFRIPVNEEHIQKAVEDWDSAYAMAAEPEQG